jgi:hypothetical protein
MNKNAGFFMASPFSVSVGRTADSICHGLATRLSCPRKRLNPEATLPAFYSSIEQPR